MKMNRSASSNLVNDVSALAEAIPVADPLTEGDGGSGRQCWRHPDSHTG
jgi:hypothetical protein